ncbi:hypothetical protein D3C84_871890 [compost metagenome]
MGRDRCVVEFFVIAQATAHDVIRLMGRHRAKALEVMLPLLERGKTAAHRALDARPHQRGGRGGFVTGVFGAVFVAGQVMAVTVAETLGDLHQAQGRRQGRLEGVAAVEQFATVGTVQPAPERLLRGRVIDTDSGQRRKWPQAFDVPVEGLDQGFTEADHRRLAVHQLHQLVQRGRQCSHRFQGEKHVASLRRNGGGEDARLVVTHVNSL